MHTYAVLIEYCTSVELEQSIAHKRTIALNRVLHFGTVVSEKCIAQHNVSRVLNSSAVQFKQGITYQHCLPASVAHLDARPTGDQAVAGSTPRRGRQHSFVEIDHEIFSTVILSLPLIQEGQLPVSGERMCTILVNPLED